MKSLLFLLAACAAAAQNPAAAPDAAAGRLLDRLFDRIVQRENAMIARAGGRSPLVETYIQETAASGASENLSDRPNKDEYFLGRFHITADRMIAYEPLLARTGAPPAKASSGLVSKIPFFHEEPKDRPLQFFPRGFAQMAFPDLQDFNRATYKFDYVRREFLGEVRCLVFDVAPIRGADPGRFLGRIWVEDQGDSIVRFDGTYVPSPARKGEAPQLYFHFDSWRVNVAPGEWAPAVIYVEEQAPAGAAAAIPRFKAQTRIWDYAGQATDKIGELTQILVDSESGVEDRAHAPDTSPLESQRAWERQAEDNVVARLEKAGFLAPPGPVDDVLNTVLNNLIVSAKLNVEAHCRVLLTTPLETFSVGHTIVISRGLIDVLPDEASLALVIADELSHIVLGQPTPTQFAFSTLTMLSDADLLQKFQFARSPEEMDAAGKKTIEIMRASPYQKKTANVGLFLKALASRRLDLPRLLSANLGNQVANADSLSRLSAFASSAPALEAAKIEQIAALPLGSRIKLNPWNNQIVLMKTRPLSLLSPREKMPFEVTPFMLHLTRVEKAAPHR
ncbi:MAG TPA: hypothetical protein VFW83_01590 [Bryobacteraceae bacterium]|nr:hypothetical protein [Bryobacteraceae bacterium]